jgi:C4-dicarboxylate-specific signal transduction histidine kinase
MKQHLLEEYEEIALDYLDRGGEDGLYRAALLGRKLVEAELGPDDVIQLHFKLLDRLLERRDAATHREVTQRTSRLLLEVMLVYSEERREVGNVLDELRARYRELDEAKSELERSRDELREKTAQLIQTEKMTALGELTAGMAHEINQPLNAIKIVCSDVVRDIVKDRFDPGQLQESLEDVIGEVKKMAEIVDHMRVFTRKTDGSQRERFDANALVDGVFRLLGQQLRVHGIEVERELGTGLHILGDPVRLEQVIMNLITNARDAVKKQERSEGKRIRLRTYLEAAGEGEDERSFVVYEVADNGDGIPERIAQKVFEPFFTSKAPGEGTGLGLSVAKQIVDDHGGRILIETAKGAGTTIRVLLPSYPANASRPPLREW